MKKRHWERQQKGSGGIRVCPERSQLDPWNPTLGSPRFSVADTVGWYKRLACQEPCSGELLGSRIWNPHATSSSRLAGLPCTPGDEDGLALARDLAVEPLFFFFLLLEAYYQTKQKSQTPTGNTKKPKKSPLCFMTAGTTAKGICIVESVAVAMMVLDGLSGWLASILTHIFME